ncbi:MAG: BamA/TamA family outer membrane protein [Gemmatimonadetes bacterium]|uniref:BamA/TamA family outer membrane protein n=1 Tax=Candidatus Kutchimonas denitrificans TaxID=3056748 RepID=A0AAE4Z6T0_9BACT|nr:BamA/TamA family outer membrane protein [Gemmatimonadota bacterium]NIR74810.1 BamA/TamA family outer membrane protein [Candidatus Kutchimonas denitrificans]NIR99921.1 BamA/TamA family outer membrane protein [Gemmatimonadota bacterium]NIT65505.1 BamA/TamA family outer membrane protein [Gemmatimonadota bacterium]NIU52475.1 BamA/TamA family outer membrane protein [Gemmatimonadota bacterium]
MKAAFSALVAAVLLAGFQTPAVAQDTVTVGVRAPLAAGEELPRSVADRLIAFYNRPSTIRFGGRTHIPAGRVIGGDVGVLAGPVDLAGVVDGDLLLINGDITLAPGSRIRGDLTVVGGVIIGLEQGQVDGVVTTYTAILRYRRVDGGIEYLGSQPRTYQPTGRTRLHLPSWELGESEIFVSARAYNRIEALPIAIGPRITTAGRNPLRLEALLVYRTIGGFSPDDSDIGYELRARQWLLGHRTVWLEAGLSSIVEPIERWQITNLENSLSLFLFRRDYRDYYEREGWYGLLGWRSNGFFGSVEFRDESHRERETNNVWTIFFNKDDELRPNAAIEAGDLNSLIFTVGVDTRTDEMWPLSGWYNTFSLEQAVGGRLDGVEQDFTRFFLDFRRYFRVSHGSVLALRLAGGGPFGGDRLPAQRQHIIGGAGSLPGYDMLEFDCGARGSADFGSVPGYGCQRFTLFQAEYRTSLDFHFHWDHSEAPQDIDFYGNPFAVDFAPAFVLFYDAGSAWDTDEGFYDHLKLSDNWVADIGAGIEFGGLGLYLAYPLVGRNDLQFVLRLDARF